MVCPSDDSLRHLLSNAEQETSSTDVLSHLAGCPACLDRVSTWNERSRLETLLRGAGQSDIAIAPASRVIIAGGVEALTCAYGSSTAPLRMIGPYEILRPIGSGGGGDVFEARHSLLQKRVAIKLLKPKHSGDQVARQRFFREMESIGQLDDPYIVHAYDAGEVDGTLYLAMELVDGENVESLARRSGPMPVADACEIIRQAALGLQHVHECRLVHRDLKPSNLLMSKTGIKIADLGLALLNRSDLIDDRLTGEHTVLGTADYMAPEQAEVSHEVDIRADIYSLGCTLFRLLAGRPPYAGSENTTPIKKMWAHASAPIPDIRQLRPEIPHELAAVIIKMMAKNREERFAEPKRLAEAIEPFCHSSDYPSLIVPVVPGSNLVSAGRSTTARDRTSPPLTDSGASLPAEVQPASLSRRTVALCVAATVAGLLIAADWWARQSTGPPSNKPVSAGQSVAQASSDEVLPTRATSVEVAPKAVVQEPPALAPLSPLGLRWRNEFDSRPVDLPWRGRSGKGTWRLDDELQALVVMSNQSIRLVKLGELNGDQIGTVRLGVDATFLSRGGSFGFFLGFRELAGDSPKAASFQVIEVILMGVADSKRNVLVRRCQAFIDSENGIVSGERNDHVACSLPEFPENIRLEIVLQHDLLAKVTMSGISSDRLCSSQLNSQFALEDYRGEFGVFAHGASVEFRKPSFHRANQ